MRLLSMEAMENHNCQKIGLSMIMILAISMKPQSIGARQVGVGKWGTPSGSWKVRDTTTFGTYDDTFDINGDGLPDLIDGCEDGHWNVYLNNGSGFDETPINWGTPSGSWKVRDTTTFGTYDDTFDINGDGLPDLIDGCEDGHWNVYLNIPTT